MDGSVRAEKAGGVRKHRVREQTRKCRQQYAKRRALIAFWIVDKQLKISFGY